MYYLGNFDDICSPDEDEARFRRSLSRYKLGSAWYEAPADLEDEVSDDE